MYSNVLLHDCETKTSMLVLVAQTVTSLPTMRETWVRFLGWEDTLEKEMAAHSSILAWRIPWTEDPDRLQSIGSQRVGHNGSNLVRSNSLENAFCIHDSVLIHIKFRRSTNRHFCIIIRLFSISQMRISRLREGR